MTPARKLEQEQEPKGYVQPAKIREEHVALNPEAPEHWRKWIVIDDHPITKAYQRGQLASGRRDYTARDRWEAGLIFRSIYEAVNGSNIASSNLNRVTGASGFDRTSENIQSARDLLKKVLERLSADNSQIIMSVCGEGKWPSEAVRERHAGFDRAVSQIFCAALDNLIDAVLSLKLYSLGRK